MDALMTQIPKPAPPATTAVATIVRDAPTQHLTAHDRCDCSAVEGNGDKTGQTHIGTCGAQAWVRVTLASGTQMMFCAHHWGYHGPKVTQKANVATVYDQREQPQVVPTPAATITQRTPLVSAK